MISPFRVDVLDSTGARKTASGPITEIKSLSFVERTDAAGTVSFNVPATSEVAGLFTTGSRLRVHVDGVGEIGEFIYKSAKLDAKQRTINIEAWDLLRELAYNSTLTDREFDELPSGVIAGQLLDLATDEWTSLVVDGNDTTIAYQGVSLLSALNTLRRQTGQHFRLNRPARSLEWGNLGEDSGVFATNLPGQQQGDIWSHPKLAVVDAFSVDTKDDQIINRVFPTGGTASTPITMALAGAVGSYTKLSLTGPGGTVYYIEDTTSQASYNIREKTVKFNTIQLVDVEWKAANSLKLAAEAFLIDNKDPIVTYTLSTRKLPLDVLPGQKIKTRVRGVTDDYKWVDVDADLFALEIARSYTAHGDQSQTVKVATSIVRPDSDASFVGSVSRDIEGLKYTG